MKTMRAVFIEEFGNRSRLKTADLPLPAPGDGEVLIRIKAAGVNPVDWKIREGYLKDLFSHRFPIVLGWEAAGVIEERGYGARRFEVGDAVYAYCRRPTVQHGTYAEYIALPEAYVATRPRNVSFEEAAAIPLAGLTAYQALFQTAGLAKGQKLMVLGASGGVGSFAVQFGKIARAEVYGVAGGANQDYLQSLGVDKTYDYRKVDFAEAFLSSVPGGADVVFDLIGGETLARATRCVKKGGSLVSIVDDISAKTGPESDLNFHFVFVEPNVRQLDHIRELVETGQLKTTVTAVHPLAEAVKAHEQIETGHTRGKIVLRV